MDTVDVNELLSYYESTIGRLHTEIAVLMADNHRLKEELDARSRKVPDHHS